MKQLMMANEMMVIADKIFDEEFDKTMFVVSKCLGTITRVYNAGKSGQIDARKFAAFVMVMDKHLPNATLQTIRNQKDIDKAYEHIKTVMPTLMAFNDLVINEGMLS